MKFTISERMRIISIINEFKGNLDTLSAIMDDVKQVKIDEEEWVKAEKKDLMTKNENGEDVSAIQWNDEKGGEKEITFEKDTLKYLRDKIKEKDSKGEITLQDVVLISLNKKLN